MTPPAWSSLPDSALNFTSTKPLSIEVSRSTAQGKLPTPFCLRTLGLLGAEGSGATAHLAAPRPVTPCCQAGGSAPCASASKLTVSANAAVAAKTLAAAMQACFTRAPFPVQPESEQSLDAWRL